MDALFEPACTTDQTEVYVKHLPLNFNMSAAARFVFPQVFQTFACDDYHEIKKRYLRADGRIDCDTPKHTAFMLYAAVMICLCEFGGMSKHPSVGCNTVTVKLVDLFKIRI